MARLYIPQVYFVEAREEYRRAGERPGIGTMDTLSFAAPVIHSTLLSLPKAVARGAPDLYAEAAGRFLTTHLLAQAEHWSEHKVLERQSPELTDRRLSRVVDFMRQHCADEPTLDQIAREAGISRFHFSRLFKRKMGVTPHRHLVQLRMKRARHLLMGTELPVDEVAVSCGYLH